MERLYRWQAAVNTLLLTVRQGIAWRLLFFSNGWSVDSAAFQRRRIFSLLGIEVLLCRFSIGLLSSDRMRMCFAYSCPTMESL